VLPEEYGGLLERFVGEEVKVGGEDALFRDREACDSLQLTFVDGRKLLSTTRREGALVMRNITRDWKAFPPRWLFSRTMLSSEL